MAEKIYPVASSNHIYYTSDIQNLNKALIKDKTLILSTSLKRPSTYNGLFLRGCATLNPTITQCT